MSTCLNRSYTREIFVAQEKRLRVIFYTSNTDKFLQARLVFEQAGLQLRHAREDDPHYSENYEAGKTKLLDRAIQQRVGSIGYGYLFFVEDTSLRIEALSENDTDYPGLAVKEWFGNITFEALDSQLRSIDKGRAVVVKSDIALYIPGLKRPAYFHGETSGHVTDTPPNFDQSRQYPWLTPYTFNGWFVPDGSSKRLGEMSFEESYMYDFRVRAFQQLLDRLEEYAAVLNLPPQSYTLRPRIYIPSSTQRSVQLPLFPTPDPALPVLIVIGRTCSGKTTFGEHACENQNYSLRHIEASAVVRMLKHEAEDETQDMLDFVRTLFSQKGYDIVAKRILQDFLSDILEQGTVITGFRTIQEVEYIKRAIPHTKTVLVEANERIRYSRYLQRGRSEEVIGFRDFRRIDADQSSLGLLRIADDIADMRIVNEGAIQEYHAKVDSIIVEMISSGIHIKEKNLQKQRERLELSVRNVDLKRVSLSSSETHTIYNNQRSQLYRCLVILSEENRPLSCEDIEQLTSKSGRGIRSNNANKVLKQFPELARRLEDGSRVRYEILDAGRVYLGLVEGRMGGNQHES